MFKHLACRRGNIAHALLWRQCNSASQTSGQELEQLPFNRGFIFHFAFYQTSLQFEDGPCHCQSTPGRRVVPFSSALALAQAKPSSSCHPKSKINLPSGTICASFSKSCWLSALLSPTGLCLAGQAPVSYLILQQGSAGSCWYSASSAVHGHVRMWRIRVFKPDSNSDIWSWWKTLQGFQQSLGRSLYCYQVQSSG